MLPPIRRRRRPRPELALLAALPLCGLVLLAIAMRSQPECESCRSTSSGGLRGLAQACPPPAEVAQATGGGACCPPPAAAPAAAEGAGAAPELEENAAQLAQAVRPPPKVSQDPVKFRFHTAAGKDLLGELHYGVHGELGKIREAEWELEYRRRWKARKWGQPYLRAQLSSDGPGVSLQWSKALLEKEVVPNGTGLDVHVESALQEYPTEDSRALQWSQRAELLVGPRAQEKLLNHSLPVGVLFGIAASRTFQDGRVVEQELPTPYFRFEAPGLPDINGLVFDGAMKERHVGLLRGIVQGPWARLFKGSSQAAAPVRWSVENTRTFERVRYPEFVGDGLAALEKRWAGRAPEPPPRPAVVPTTRFLASSEGGAAALNVESAESGLGSSGYGGSVEVSKEGWGAQLRLAVGNPEGDLGQPRYSVTATAPWKGKATYQQQLKWVFTDGQYVELSYKGRGPGGKPRINVGLELR